MKLYKDEISEKMTMKGRAVISSTRNASIRLEKSVKNLLTRRLTSSNQDDIIRDNSIVNKKFKDPVEEERCVSMPTDDIFSSISFYSPLNSNLRSIKMRRIFPERVTTHHLLHILLHILTNLSTTNCNLSRRVAVDMIRLVRPSLTKSTGTFPNRLISLISHSIRLVILIKV